MALTKSAIEGNLPSIIYLNKMTGRFDPDKDRQIADVQSLLRQIIDIVTTEVTDPATLRTDWAEAHYSHPSERSYYMTQSTIVIVAVVICVVAALLVIFGRR